MTEHPDDRLCALPGVVRAVGTDVSGPPAERPAPQ